MERPYDSRRWRKLRLQIIARDGGCTACGRTDRLDVDHIIPWDRGGPWFDPTNLRTLCRTCHNRKTHSGPRVRPIIGTSRTWL